MKQEKQVTINGITHTLKVLSGGAEPESSLWRPVQYINGVSRNLTEDRFIDIWASLISNDEKVRNNPILKYISNIAPAQINEKFEVEHNGERKTTDLFSIALELNNIPALKTITESLLLTTTAMPILFILAKQNKWEVILDALEKQGNAVKDLNIQENGQTLLHLALNTSKIKVAEKLIDLNAKCDIANNYNKLPLHLAIASGQQEVARKLFEKYPAALEYKDAKNKTPLNYAAGTLRASPLFEKMQSYVEQVSQSTTTQQARSM